MLADYHMHTNYSNDSQYDMEKAILKAIDMGLDGYVLQNIVIMEQWETMLLIMKIIIKVI